MMRNRIPSVAVATVAIALVLSCTEGQQNPVAPTEPELARGGPGVKAVTVTPSSATVAVGGTVQFTATASPPKSASTFAWATGNSGVAAGTTTITASAGGVTGTASITVTTTPPPSGDPVLVGAGDIASCSSSGDEATANLLDGI